MNFFRVSCAVIFLCSLVLSPLKANEWLKYGEWDSECSPDKGCIFFHDAIHEVNEKREAITIAIAVGNKNKNIEYISIHYPPNSEESEGGGFAFATASTINGELLFEPKSETITSLPFESCDNESCVIRFNSSVTDKFGYSLKAELLNDSFILFIYFIDGQPIRAIAPLGSFKEQYDRMSTQNLAELDQTKETAESYLQQGHNYSRNQEYNLAIEMFEKALEVEPEYSAASRSLTSAVNKLAAQQWAEKLSEQCKQNHTLQDTETMLDCAEKYFSFNGEPINPSIINNLYGFIFDSGEQVISIHLSDSQDSNMFCCDGNVSISSTGHIGTPNNWLDPDEGWFSYKHIGSTDNGIHFLLTYYNGGGRQTFETTLMVTFNVDYGFSMTKGKGAGFELNPDRPRVVISNLGFLEYPEFRSNWEDEWSESITFKGNWLEISPQEKWLVNRSDLKSKDAYTTRIKVSRQ